MWYLGFEKHFENVHKMCPRIKSPQDFIRHTAEAIVEVNHLVMRPHILREVSSFPKIMISLLNTLTELKIVFTPSQSCCWTIVKVSNNITLVSFLAVFCTMKLYCESILKKVLSANSIFVFMLLMFLGHFLLAMMIECFIFHPIFVMVSFDPEYNLIC